MKEPCAGVVSEAVHMAVLSGKDAGAGRPGDGVGHIGAVHAHPLLRNPVEIGGPHQLAAVAAYPLPGMVVGHHDNDVRPALLRGLRGRKTLRRHRRGNCGQHGQSHQVFVHGTGGKRLLGYNDRNTVANLTRHTPYPHPQLLNLIRQMFKTRHREAERGLEEQEIKKKRHFFTRLTPRAPNGTSATHTRNGRD